MSPTPKPITELDAVNIMLRTIGETPVNSLSGEQVADVSEARETLNEVSRSVQAKGWHFNREEEVPFARDVNNEISIPDNVARFDVPNRDIINRGGKAYDKEDRTYEFEKTLKATVVYYLPFDQLPESARYYITVKAARLLADRLVTSEDIRTFTQRDELEARADFLDENEENADRTMLDNWAVGRVVHHRPSRRAI